MFNTYQELVDRINELLAERKSYENKMLRLESLYRKVPKRVIEEMYRSGKITLDERIFWYILNNRKEKK